MGCYQAKEQGSTTTGPEPKVLLTSIRQPRQTVDESGAKKPSNEDAVRRRRSANNSTIFGSDDAVRRRGSDDAVRRRSSHNAAVVGKHVWRKVEKKAANRLPTDDKKVDIKPGNRSSSDDKAAIRRRSSNNAESFPKNAVSAPWWIKEDIILGAQDGSKFSIGQQEKFSVTEEGEIQQKSKFDVAIAKVNEVRRRITEDKAQVMSVDDFQGRDIEPQSIVHLKGFGHGLEDQYVDDVVKMMEKYQVLVWDGDEYDITGFTKIVPMFLDANPQNACVAFRLDYEIDDLKESWADVIEKYPGRISIVSVNLKFPTLLDARRLGVLEEMKKASELPEWAQEYFLLGRVACQATKSNLVISLGGGGISKSEAQAGMAVGVEWTIFDLRRKGDGPDGWRDEKGRALMDWVRQESVMPSSIRVQSIGTASFKVSALHSSGNCEPIEDGTPSGDMIVHI